MEIPRSRASLFSMIVTLAFFAAAACGDDDPTAPPPVEETGSLEVTTSTTGEPQDSDGYTLTVDGDDRPIGTDETVTIEDLAEGDHEVTLSGLPDNCTVDGEASRTVSVPADGQAQVTFAVECSETGSLEVTTSTTGEQQDSDGYTLTVDGEDQPIGTDETVTIEDLAEGDHEVTLGDVAENCAVEGEASRTVTITADEQAQVTFDVTCAENLENVILFTSFRDGNFEVYRMNADGTEQTNLSDASGRDLRPSVPLDGSRVAFTTDRFGGGLEVATMLSDGSGVARVTDSGGENRRPRWFADGSQIAFASDRDGGALEIYVIDEDGSDPRRLTENQAVDTHPAPSPDGSRIAFTSDRDGGDQDIYLMDADGSNVVRLTDSGSDDFRAAWSPDGSQIAFTSERDGNQEVYVMGADGSNQVNLTDHSANDAEPAFSPDGTRLAFSSDRDDNDFDIYTMDPDGSNVGQPLTTASGTDEDPMWSAGS